MPFRVEINGVKIEVDTPEELQSIIALNTKSPVEVKEKPSADIHEKNSDTSISDEDLIKKLVLIKGTPAAEILLFLFEKQDHIATDTELREHLGGEGTLGPRLANLSKVLKNADIEKDLVFQRKAKRVAKGKQIYWYKITPQAVQAIGSIDDFDKEPTDSELFIRPEDF